MSEELRVINVRREERLISVVVGGALILVMLRPRGVWGLMLALVGAKLVYRGLTGHSYIYTFMEINTEEDRLRAITAARNGGQQAPTEERDTAEKDDVDMTSEQSFPASDPPSFTTSST